MESVCRAVLLLLLLARGDAQVRDDACSSWETCAGCLRTPDCVWCGDPKLGQSTDSVPIRCREKGTSPAGWCAVPYLVDEQPEVEVLENMPLRDPKDGDMVQLAPQRVRLRLRVGKPYDLNIYYRHAKDYPVDLYYLMDLSHSMLVYKDKLSELGDNLTSRMQALTTNFSLGFGTFVDKVVMPFTSTVPSRLKNPCAPLNCSPPFSFKNNMPLSTNTKEFKNEVKDSKISGNLDSPEGGLDALLQAMVCKSIGWRTNSRRIIIYSSDAPFHIAGDGRLAGIIAPNDGLCHLDSNGTYTEALNMDYPSISQIRRIAADTKTTIIFAITKSFKTAYTILSANIELSAVGILKNDSTNVVDLVVKEYEKLTDNVRLTTKSGENVEVKYFSKCVNLSQTSETPMCGGLKRGVEVTFTATITATSCSANAGMIEKQQLIISPAGINENVMVDLEIICGCDCSQGGMSQKNSTMCSNHGDLECGVCRCHPGYLGDHCKCKSDSSSPLVEETAGCKDERNETCSGHGTCVCNECQCKARPNKKERYYGKFCECDNFSCRRHEGKVCADHGDCSCGKCMCRPGWTGEACQCADTMEGCRRPSETVICSDRGYCECSQCVCNETTKEGHHYSGQYCEECPSCPGALCKNFEVCVQCKLNNSKLLEEAEECGKCGYVSVVDNIRDKDDYDSNLDKICPVADGQGCTLYFRYRFLDGVHKLWVQKEKECGPNVTGVIFGVIGATVLIGLLIILIWKICTTIHDKREFAKFEKERALSKWDRGGNPLYQPSTSTFTNPTFKKS